MRSEEQLFDAQPTYTSTEQKTRHHCSKSSESSKKEFKKKWKSVVLSKLWVIEIR